MISPKSFCQNAGKCFSEIFTCRANIILCKYTHIQTHTNTYTHINVHKIKAIVLNDWNFEPEFIVSLSIIVQTIAEKEQNKSNEIVEKRKIGEKRKIWKRQQHPNVLNVKRHSLYWKNPQNYSIRIPVDIFHRFPTHPNNPFNKIIKTQNTKHKTHT